ncbi:sensor histidine kinase [Croceicoccus naphthovorans]|nr:PAS domain-containing sensor histidine kinase [Croceicoccus naphthovorans]
MVDAYDWSSNPLGPRADWPRELEATVQQILDSEFPAALVWGADLITIYNDAFRPILGKKQEALGRSFSDIWAEAWDEIGPIADRALAGESTFIENFPLIINRAGRPEQAHFTFCYSPLRLADGTVQGMLDTVIETTRTVEVQGELTLVNEELAHRLKNSLAIVQAIASQTLRDSCEDEAFESFQHRLGALAHAHEVLLQQDWSTGSLRNAVRASLEPHVDLERVAISGIDLSIGSKTTMALSMMLHELATNAVKYGAMSSKSGTVAISWAMDGPDMAFRWVESGGPRVEAPPSMGFGSRLIRRGFGGEHSGELSFDPGGISFVIKTPVVELAR